MPTRPSILIRVAVIAAAMAAFPAARAIAGPPYQTDDPEPVPYQHFEFYTFSVGTAVRGDTSGVGPAWEFNYGLVPNGQVHIIAPMSFDGPAGGPSQFGYGDTELGFKYRFIDEEEHGSRPMVGVYPLIELPTGDALTSRSGFKRVSAIGRPMAAAATGSTTATAPPIATIGSSVGCCSGR